MSYLILLFFFIPLHLAAEVWQVNPDHSELFFKIPYLNISNVTGRFNNFSGTLTFNKDNNPNQILLKIEAASINTGNQLRDGHLKSQEFLKSKTHPYIIFKSEEISRGKNSTFQARGKLIIADVAREHTIKFSLSHPARDTWNYTSRFVKFSTQISRRYFKILWNKTLAGNTYLLGDTIKVWGSFQLQPSQGRTPPSKHMIPDTPYIRGREKLLRGEKVESEAASANLPQTRPRPFPLMDLKERRGGQPVNTQQESLSKNFRDLRWWISFAILGLMGFLSSIIIGLYAKKWIIKIYPEKYREGGALGLASDSISIFFIFVYVLVLWEVGWG